MSKKQLFMVDVNSVVPGTNTFELKSVIDTSYTEIVESPIDVFINNGIELNKLSASTDLPTVLSNLILLGYVSAVESYLRAIIRKLIIIDPMCQKNCEAKSIAFGAAALHEKAMLPEALFDGISLASKEAYYKILKNFLDIHIDDKSIPLDLLQTINQFDEVCELRHCIIHRFGKFGSKNAIALGIYKHRKHIEKPIVCDFDSLQQIMRICQNTVRITNNFLFHRIINRLIYTGNSRIEDTVWTWDYNVDKNLFNQYYNVFYSKSSSPNVKIGAKSMYDKYKTYYDDME